MNKQKVYMIDGDMYEDIVRERVTLYSFIRQLSYMSKRLFSQEDIKHLQEMAQLFGEQAEALFDCWNIPHRFLAFGESSDLAAIKELELLDYEGEDEDDPDEDWEEAFFRGMRNGAGTPNVIVMDLDEIIAKMEALDKPYGDSTSGD